MRQNSQFGLRISNNFIKHYDRNIEKCLKFNELINNNGYLSKVDIRNEKIGYKIREATLGRFPLIAVIGDKEEEIDSVAKSFEWKKFRNFQFI